MRNILLAQALNNVLGPGELGSIAFVRCILPDQIAELCADPQFKVPGWRVFGIVARSEANIEKLLVPAMTRLSNTANLRARRPCCS